MGKPTVRWKDQPEDHDFPAAAAYLALLLDDATVSRLVDELRVSRTEHRKAKDILRAARLALLDADDPHVAGDLAKIHAGRALSPVLLVRGDLRAGVALTIADGYHRVCASYQVDENTDIPCRIVGFGA